MKERKTIGKCIIAFCLIFVLGIGMMAGCGQEKKEGFTVSFDTCTNLETNKIKERVVKAGELVSQPNVYPAEEKYSNYLIEG